MVWAVTNLPMNMETVRMGTSTHTTTFFTKGQTLMQQPPIQIQESNLEGRTGLRTSPQSTELQSVHQSTDSMPSKMSASVLSRTGRVATGNALKTWQRPASFIRVSAFYSGESLVLYLFWYDLWLKSTI